MIVSFELLGYCIAIGALYLILFNIVWNKIEKSGTPLIENINSDENHKLVTFIVIINVLLFMPNGIMGPRRKEGLEEEEVLGE